jgi:hypothetical protein
MGDEIDVGDLESETPTNREAHLRNLNAGLLRQIKSLQEQLGNREEFIAEVCGSIVAQEPYPPFSYPKRKAKHSSPVVPVLVLSDWHIGEVVNANEVEGFNAYNWEIAQAGVFGLVEDFLRWVEIQRSFYPINECALFVLGDMISGDIHGELIATNEFPLPVQTANAGNLLGEVFRIISGHFKKVTAYEVAADNHSRLQKKPQAKQKSQNSMGYLVHEIAGRFAGKCKNFKPVIADGMKMVAKVNGRGFLLEHGDNLRGVLGIPFYAYARSIGREATKRMGTNLGFDFYVTGHFHTPCIIEGRTIINGSLSGTSEYDHAAGRWARPCQVAFLTHPHHGIFNFTPFVRRDVKK